MLKLPHQLFKQQSRLPFRQDGVQSFVQSALGSATLKALGWRIEGDLPDVPKVIAIGFPHTSNWDFIIGLSVMLATNLQASWIAKKEMFDSPLGSVWQTLGGIPIDRKAKMGVVQQQIEALNKLDKVFLLIEPEGTREVTDTWKSGFYHIAHQTNTPILPVTWDYSRKVVNFFPLFYTTGDKDADIATLMAMADKVQARFPHKSPWQGSTNK